MRDMHGFLSPSVLQQEDQSFFHHYVDPEAQSSKIKFKYIDDEGNFSAHKNYLIKYTEQAKGDVNSSKAKLLRRLEGDDANARPSLLERPVESLLEEIFSEIIEEKKDSTEIEQVPPEEEIMSKEDLLWIDKYMPHAFTDLLSDDKINREVLTWLKTWDQVVFKKKVSCSTQRELTFL